MTLGVVAGLRAAAPDRRVAVLWFDAHGDLQTPATSASGFFDGMGFAMMGGRCWQALAATVPGHAPLPDELAVLVGGHALDHDERVLLAATPAPAWLSVEDIRADRTDAVLDRVAASSDAVHIHVDLDVHDPSVAPANSYAKPGGLLPEEVRDVVAAAVARLPLASATVASWDPALDVGHRMRDTGLALLEHLATLVAGARASRPGRCPRIPTRPVRTHPDPAGACPQSEQPATASRTQPAPRPCTLLLLPRSSRASPAMVQEMRGPARPSA